MLPGPNDPNPQSYPIASFPRRELPLGGAVGPTGAVIQDRMIHDAIEIRLSRKERAVLEARLRAGTTEQRELRRTRIVLEAAEGLGTREIARELDTTPTTVSLWRGRFARQRLDGLEDLPRSGAPPVYDAETDKRIRAILDQSPPKGFARWTGPLIAEALGDVDVQYVWRSLRKQKIDLSGRKSCCESKDPQFAIKAADVVGLYMAPPDDAVYGAAR